ncbi:GTPase IMAP family member 4-like [Poecilia reticulata]|uniref:GTPase IMAP family member 4-like n=1 Tax=Poecilia reticulata TaxID=8081 RepID=UPI0007EA3CE1|nr:PREDICTED: GTPase IMAP family member 4-like [Poecilia reticulata]
MCSPGPDVFLLVVPILRSFTEKDLKALVEILNPLTERVWRHCMVLFTKGNWLNGLPVENYIVREGKELQELLEKCGNRFHVLNPKSFDYFIQIQELFQKIIDMLKQNKKCFNKGKENKHWILPLQAKQIEKEWNRREQELIERVIKALANEPGEPAAPPAKAANSMNDFNIPDLSGDVGSEYGSISDNWRRRGHDQVAEWLTKTVRASAISSGIGSICSSNICMENLDEYPLIDKNHPPMTSFSQSSEEDPLSMFSKIQRRNSC